MAAVYEWRKKKKKGEWIPGNQWSVSLYRYIYCNTRTRFIMDFWSSAQLDARLIYIQVLLNSFQLIKVKSSSQEGYLWNVVPCQSKVTFLTWDIRRAPFLPIYSRADYRRPESTHWWDLKTWSRSSFRVTFFIVLLRILCVWQRGKSPPSFDSMWNWIWLFYSSERKSNKLLFVWGLLSARQATK